MTYVKQRRSPNGRVGACIALCSALLGGGAAPPEKSSSPADRPVFAWRKPYKFDGPRTRLSQVINYGCAICFSGDGKLLLAGYSDGGAVLLDSTNGKRIARYNVNDAYREPSGWFPGGFIPTRVEAVALVPGRRLCMTFYRPFHSRVRGGGKLWLDSGPVESRVLWNYSGKKVRSFKDFRGAIFPPLVSVCDTGKLFAAPGGDFGGLVVRETATGRLKHKFEFAHGDNCTDLGPKGERCVIGLSGRIIPDRDNAVHAKTKDFPPGSTVEESIIDDFGQENIAVVNLKEGTTSMRNVGHLLGVIDVRILADGNTCVSLSNEGMIVVWSIGDGSVTSRFWSGTRSFPQSLAVDQNLRMVAVGSGRVVRLFKLETGKCIETLSIPEQGYQPAHPDAEAHDLHVRLPHEPLQHHVSCIALSSTTKRLAVMYHDGLIEVWPYSDKPTGETRALRRKRK